MVQKKINHRLLSFQKNVSGELAGDDTAKIIYNAAPFYQVRMTILPLK